MKTRTLLHEENIVALPRGRTRMFKCPVCKALNIQRSECQTCGIEIEIVRDDIRYRILRNKLSNELGMTPDTIDRVVQRAIEDGKEDGEW